MRERESSLCLKNKEVLTSVWIKYCMIVCPQLIGEDIDLLEMKLKLKSVRLFFSMLAWFHFPYHPAVHTIQTCSLIISLLSFSGAQHCIGFILLLHITWTPAAVSPCLIHSCCCQACMHLHITAQALQIKQLPQQGHQLPQPASQWIYLAALQGRCPSVPKKKKKTLFRDLIIIIIIIESYQSTY